MTIKSTPAALVAGYRRRAVWGVIVVVVVVIGVRWWIGSPVQPRAVPAPASPAPASPSPPEAEIPFLHVEGSRLAGVDPAGRKLWELRAKTVQIDRERNTVTFTEVVGQLYQAGVPQFMFTALRGVMFIGSRDVELAGGVSGRTSTGRSLQAPQVRWDAARQQLTASGGITLTEPGMVISADKVVTDAALHRTTFTGNIRVKVTQSTTP